MQKTETLESMMILATVKPSTIPQRCKPAQPRSACAATNAILDSSGNRVKIHARCGRNECVIFTLCNLQNNYRFYLTRITRLCDNYYIGGNENEQKKADVRQIR